MRLVSASTVLLGLLLWAAGLQAADYPLHPYSYQQGFEDEMPTVSQWASNGPSKVNFVGASEELAFEGKRSLKLDVSLEGGSYHYFGVPLRVPAAGDVTLSARIYVAEGTTASVGFGTNMVYPPTHHSGCGSIETLRKPTDAWKLMQLDLDERGANGKAQVMSRYTATAKGDHVGAYLDRWALFIYGGKGTRAIVYLDDIRIEGQIPSELDYDLDIKRRWGASQERLAERITGWRAQLAEAEAQLADLSDVTPEVEAAVGTLAASVQSVKDSVGKAREKIDALEKAGYGGAADVDQIKQAIFTVRYGPETIDAVLKARQAKAPFLVYAPQAITNDRLTAQTFPIPARVAQQLECSGCRGEYESIAAALYALEDLDGVLVTCSDLVGPEGIIPSQAVDVYAVKSWYQAGRSIADRSHKMLVPELLLKDSDLVRVDLQEQQNYLRSTAEDGTETYLLCSGKTGDNLAGVRPIDADELQPVDVKANTLRPFWIRLHIPPDAAPGLYEGSVSFTTPAGSQDIPLRVTVHPFELAPSPLIYSIYYRATLAADGNPTITSERRSEEQYRAELEDMRDHGVLYPTNYEGWSGDRLQRMLEIRQEVGLPTEAFYNLGRGTGSTTDPQELATLKADVAKWIELCEGFGYEQVYFYGIDEARGDRLAAQRATWKAVQEAGGKTFVACYTKTFEAMGSLLNCAVLAGRPNPEERAKWHSVDSHAFTYAYPQVGNEEPETYRRNFGLVLWRAGFDGAMDYAYQHGFGHVWNDFDSTSYRDHNFSYPTVNGVVGTVQWEGFREAVDDVRYAATLQAAIEGAPGAKADVAKAAQDWLDTMDPDLADLYEVRAAMVDWINKLR